MLPYIGVVIHMSNKLRLFRYLCLDLDMRFLSNQIDLNYLLTVRSALLNVVEIDTTHNWNELIDTLRKSFSLNNWDLNLATSCGTPTNIQFVRAVYYISSFLLKVESPVSLEQQSKYVERFKKTEAEVSTEKWTTAPLLDSVRYYINRLWQGVTLDSGSVLSHYRDGPGAVYERFNTVIKKTCTFTYRALNYYYPMDTFISTSDYASIETYQGWRTWNYMLCRLTLVPKDFRGPRGVFIHPTLAMRVQQGQRSIVEQAIERCPAIKLKRQDLNQEQAHIGSYNRSIATLDLSDASDRISKSLVAYLFRSTQWKYLAASRASHCMLPNWEIHRLKMFAPMGSALCFPMQSSIFASIVICSIYYYHTGSAILQDSRLVDMIANSVRVYGDDITVPSYAFTIVVDALESFGLKVNKHKSFVHGFFRESCGYDAYHGINITPPRLRVDIDNFGNANDFASLVSFHNRLRLHYSGLHKTVRYLASLVERRWPQVGYTSRTDAHPTCLYCDASELARKNQSRPVRVGPTHYIEHQVLTVRAVTEEVTASIDRWLLNDWFYSSKRSTEPVESNRYAHPRLAFRRGWRNISVC